MCLEEDVKYLIELVAQLVSHVVRIVTGSSHDLTIIFISTSYLVLNDIALSSFTLMLHTRQKRRWKSQKED